MCDSDNIFVRIWNIQYIKIQMFKLMIWCAVIMVPINILSLIATTKLNNQRVSQTDYIYFNEQIDIFYPANDYNQARDFNYVMRQYCEDDEKKCQKNINGMFLCGPKNQKCPPIRVPGSPDEYKLYDVSDKGKQFQGFQTLLDRYANEKYFHYPVIQDDHGYDYRNFVTVSVNYYSNVYTDLYGTYVFNLQKEMNDMILLQTFIFYCELIFVICIVTFTFLGLSLYKKSIENRYLDLKQVFNPFLICIAFTESDFKLEQIKQDKKINFIHMLQIIFVNFIAIVGTFFTVINYFYFIKKLVIFIEHHSDKNDHYENYDRLINNIKLDSQTAYQSPFDGENWLYTQYTVQQLLAIVDRCKICYESFILMKTHNNLLYAVFIISLIKILIFTILNIYDQIRLLFRRWFPVVLFYLKEDDTFVPFKNINSQARQIQDALQSQSNLNNQGQQIYSTQLTGQGQLIKSSQLPFQPSQNLFSYQASQNQLNNQENQNQPPPQYFPQNGQNVLPISNIQPYQNQQVILIKRQQIIPIQYYQQNQYANPIQYNQPNFQNNNGIRLQPIVLNPTQNTLPSQQYLQYGSQNQFNNY